MTNLWHVIAGRLARSEIGTDFRAYFHLWRWTSDMARTDELRRGAEIQRAAAEAARGVRFNRPLRLMNAAQTQFTLAVYTEDVELARDAVALARRGLAQARWGRRLLEVGVAQQLFALHWITGELDAAQEGVALWLRAIAHGRFWRGPIVFLMAPLVRFSAEQAGNTEMFQETIRICQETADAGRWWPPRRGKRDDYVSELCAGLSSTFTYSFDVDYMRRLIDRQRRGLRGRADGRAGRRRSVRRREHLSRCLHGLFERTGDPAMLAESISILRTVVAATPLGHPDAPAHLSRLGSTLMTAYRSTGELAVLTEAVSVGRAACAALPGDKELPLALTNVARSLEELCARTGDIDALREAVVAYRGAANAADPERPTHVSTRSNLAAALHRLSVRTEDAGAAQEALSTARAAVSAAPAGHPLRTTALNILGIVLSDAADSPELRGEAVAAYRDAIAAEPPDHHDEALLSNLGVSLYHSALADGSPEQLSEARSLLARAAAAPEAPVGNRINILRSLARAEGLAGEHAAATAAIARAVELLPFTAPTHLRRTDREFRLGDHSGIAEEAAACALSAGRPEQALVLLEQARGVVLADLMGRRSILTSLHRSAPELADRLERAAQRAARLEASPAVAYEADPTMPRLNSGPAGQLVLRPAARRAAAWRRSQRQASLIDAERTAAAAEFESVLAEIRARPDLAEQLAPPSLDRLRAQTSDAPTVYVNAARDRCDALILPADPSLPVQHVPLPRLSRRDVVARIPVFRNAHRAFARDLEPPFTPDPSDPSDPSRRDGLLVELAWLWDCVAEPVLTALEHTRTPAPGEPWPRIRWCPVGVATYLPLHAAGHHDEAARALPAPRTVLDRAVSTYTTTVRTLTYSRRRPSAQPEGRALIVAMPETSDASSLPGVAAEARLLAELLPGATILEGSDATYETVRAALPDHRIAHFACHGLSDWADPAASRLLLHDHASRPLTVTAVSDLNLTSADLAYLSACSTSDTNLLMADEALHITSAFQLAGYRHVIGTLWPTGDYAAASIARSVYGHLTAGGTRPPAVAETALALHHAVRALRGQPATKAALWASHMHLGD
jgi:tetratricopeptide (TPR) repeat protein